mmetsp:Transcript_18319/g.49514  ORF Transcript_18319/g.49514 Transcript_18319/m.49514 type:complete len:268 (+) Transcript_18319:30-833(+)
MSTTSRIVHSSFSPTFATALIVLSTAEHIRHTAHRFSPSPRHTARTTRRAEVSTHTQPCGPAETRARASYDIRLCCVRAPPAHLPCRGCVPANMRRLSHCCVATQLGSCSLPPRRAAGPHTSGHAKGAPTTHPPTAASLGEATQASQGAPQNAWEAHAVQTPCVTTSAQPPSELCALLPYRRVRSPREIASIDGLSWRRHIRCRTRLPSGCVQSPYADAPTAAPSSTVPIWPRGDVPPSSACGAAGAVMERSACSSGSWGTRRSMRK